MTTRKSQNSILLLATLGVYLGLVLAGATPQVLAQGKIDDEITINKRPLADLSVSVRKKIESKDIDFTSPFSVECDVSFTKQGGIDQKLTKFTVISGDQKMAEFAKNTIEAVGDSGYFQYLQDLDITKAKIKISQDNQNFSVHFLSHAKTVTRARSISSILNMMVQLADRETVNEDDKLILKSMTTTTDQTELGIHVVMPAAKFQELLTRKLTAHVND